MVHERWEELTPDPDDFWEPLDEQAKKWMLWMAGEEGYWFGSDQ
jgi:hypothetical protein